MKEERGITQTNAHNFILRVPEGSFVNQFLYITHAQARMRAHTRTQIYFLNQSITFAEMHLF